MRSRSFSVILIVLAIVLAALVATAVPACRRPTGPTIETARAFAGRFMAARFAGQVAGARGMLSTKGATAFDGPNQPVLDLSATGDSGAYLPIGEETGPDAGVFMFTYRIRQTGREASFAALWDETITVLATGSALAVDGVTMANEAEAFLDESLTVQLTMGGKTTKLFSMDDLPDEFTPLGAGPDVVLGVGKEGFSLLSFAPSGTRLGFVTWGVHGFLGVVNLPGGDPVGIDLHWEGLTVDIGWSPDSQYAAAVIEQPTGNTALSIYRISPPERLQLGLEAMFAPEQYSLSSPVWQSPNMFSLVVEHRDSAQDSKNGQWIVDITEKTIKRPANASK